MPALLNNDKIRFSSLLTGLACALARASRHGPARAGTGSRGSARRAPSSWCGARSRPGARARSCTSCTRLPPRPSPLQQRQRPRRPRPCPRAPARGRDAAAEEEQGAEARRRRAAARDQPLARCSAVEPAARHAHARLRRGAAQQARFPLRSPRLRHAAPARGPERARKPDGRSVQARLSHAAARAGRLRAVRVHEHHAGAVGSAQLLVRQPVRDRDRDRGRAERHERHGVLRPALAARHRRLLPHLPAAPLPAASICSSTSAPSPIATARWASTISAATTRPSSLEWAASARPCACKRG